MPKNTNRLKQMSHRYPSDLSDSQWSKVESLFLPSELKSGRKYHVRDTIDAILFAETTGSTWSSLPNDLPHWRTVYSQFIRWQDSGMWDKIQGAIKGRTSSNSFGRSSPTVFVRQGRLNYQTYGRYSPPEPATQRTSTNTLRKIKRRSLYLVIIIVAVLVAYNHFNTNKPRNLSIATSVNRSTPSTKPPKPLPAKVTTTPTTTSLVNHCLSNKLPQLALVSISQRHMWACNGQKQVFDSAVVTGMTAFVADTTPTGTYRIYAKETNLYLSGSDSSGSWNDYVYYWMPFLQNQYGSYGFHDATWRPANAFGNISPSSRDASHGCVELPLASATWMYQWASIGTTVTITN